VATCSFDFLVSPSMLVNIPLKNTKFSKKGPENCANVGCLFSGDILFIVKYNYTSNFLKSYLFSGHFLSSAVQTSLAVATTNTL
jgi:hypothetical protein